MQELEMGKFHINFMLKPFMVKFVVFSANLRSEGGKRLFGGRGTDCIFLFNEKLQR